MKTFKNCLLLTALFIFLSANVFAGDYAHLNFIGFSKDGKYIAFEEYGTQDGSGFPYSNIYIIDVAKNSYAVAPVRTRIDNENATEAQARAKAKLNTAANLRRFAIVAGNTGDLVVSRLLTDLAMTEEPLKGEFGKPQKINFTDYRESNYFADEYSLKLTPSEVKGGKCDAYADSPIYKFTLVFKNEKSEIEKILQRDANLPDSRSCPIDYSIQNVYVYQGKIAVFLNVFTIGFEGPDMRYLAVTGNYK